MVSMWYMDDDEEADQRLPHQTDPPRMVGVEALRKCTGVLYWKIDVNLSPNAELQKLCKERGYNYEDLIEIHPSKLVNYEEKLKIFYEEHLHSDEEIRLILEGSGYFDVRDHNDKWIRIEMVKGDLIILPAGIYHRFTLDSKNYIKATRFFVGEPVWTPYKRPADSHPARIQYLKEQQTAALCLTA